MSNNRLSRRRIRVSALCASLASAAAALSYALATSQSFPVSQANGRALPTAQGGALNPPLRFTSPFLLAGTTAQGVTGNIDQALFPGGGNTNTDPQGFDLGDLVQSQSIHRTLTAAGGYLPYTFRLAPNLSTPPLLLPTLSPIGVLTGPVEAAGSFIRFNITLTDFIATQRNAIFYLKLLNAPVKFRFAQENLPTAQQGNHFYTTLETLSGAGAVTYKVSGSVTSTSTAPALPAGARLEDAGLCLAPDGTLFGRPLVSGLLSFAVQATDAAGNIAAPHSGAGTTQQFALNVEANTEANSELTTLSCAIRGTQAANGKDTLSYSGLLDTRNETAASLAGSALTVRIGQTALTGNFDARGRVSVTFPDNEKLTATLKNGRLNVKLTKANLAAGLGVSSIGAKTAVNVVIGLDLLSFRTSDLLNLTAIPRAGKYSMQYRLGVNGLAMTGGFQVIAVRGFDGATGSPVHLSLHDGLPLKAASNVLPDGDSWDVFFFAIPRIGIDGGKSASDVITGNTSATIRIGSSFSQMVTLTALHVLLEFKTTGSTAGIFRLDLNPKTLVHHLQTNSIGESDTSIPPAITTKDLTVFPFELDLTGFSGQSGRVIAPNRGQWTQR